MSEKQMTDHQTLSRDEEWKSAEKALTWYGWGSPVCLGVAALLVRIAVVGLWTRKRSWLRSSGGVHRIWRGYVDRTVSRPGWRPNHGFPLLPYEFDVSCLLFVTSAVCVSYLQKMNGEISDD